MQLPRRAVLAGAFLAAGPAGWVAYQGGAVFLLGGDSGTGGASRDGPPNTSQLTLYASRYATLNAALAAWTVSGGRLVIDQDWVTTETFGPADGSLLPDKDYVLETAGVRTITYDGPIKSEFLRFYQGVGRANLTIRGPLTIDCRNKAGTGLWIDNQLVSGPARRDITIDGLHVRNCRLHSDYSGGANGIRITGGADRLAVRDWSVSDITRKAGTGLAGSYGSAGLVVFGHPETLANPKRILIEQFRVKTIATDDLPGTAAYGDGDGVLVFQYKVGNDDVEAPIIRDGVIENAFGRAIKRYATAFGGLTERITVIRNVQGVNTGSVDLAHQDGSGTIRDIRFVYSGDAHVTATKPIGMSLGIRANPGPVIVENIRIEDTTGAVKGCLFQLFYGFPDPTPRTYSIRDIRDTGKAECLFLPGGIGAHGPASITLANIDCELTRAVCLTDDHIIHMRVTGAELTNRGPDVPVVRYVTAPHPVKPDRWGTWRAEGPLRGFARRDGRGTNTAGFSNGFS